jgi:UDP-N-acetylmuramoylalanine--D-glutamate ligase
LFVLDLRGKRVVVVGLGASGVAAARLCLRRGARVVATDAKSLDALGADARALATAGAELVVGGHAEAKIDQADLVVVSPGVPPFAELESAEKKGVRVIGEVELATASLMHSAPIVAIGGTNGKSTTTSLVGAILEAHGGKVFTGGNLGEPLASHADETFDAIVLEVSSFQMERVDAFAPRVSVLLNVTEDHLDRYASFEAYAAAKGNAFARQSEGDTAVVPVGDDVCLRQARRGRGRVVTFGPGGDVDVTAEEVIDRASGERYARASFSLRGGHNALNVAAAIATVRELGVSADTIRRVVTRFRGLAHRMALVGEIEGVRYYDDSKGTNVGAVVTALQGLDEPKAVLIAGGRDKEGSYAPLVAALREKGRAAVLIGEAAEIIAKAIGDAVPVARARTMDEAVRASATFARRGDAVLLSPACSSYDMFRDYKHRGDEFVRAVRKLEEATA